jgi:hypothetical protein
MVAGTVRGRHSVIDRRTVASPQGNWPIGDSTYHLRVGERQLLSFARPATDAGWVEHLTSWSSEPEVLRLGR